MSQETATAQHTEIRKWAGKCEMRPAHVKEMDDDDEKGGILHFDLGKPEGPLEDMSRNNRRAKESVAGLYTGRHVTWRNVSASSPGQRNGALSIASKKRIAKLK